MGIEVLDCTLRDGGYCNNWGFGKENISYIIKKLLTAKIDIIEIGFISDKKEETKDNTIFRTVKKIKESLPVERNISKFVCMCNYGEVDFEKLEEAYITNIDGIRLAFHKKDWKKALEVGKIIKSKGYELYLQPMVTMSYSDTELLELIESSNVIEPAAFYIVDSFGVVRENDLMRMYYLVHHNLDLKIKIGYHSHNNMQLSYANSQAFVKNFDERKKIIDASVFGMGRGAGNLNTELFVEYLNRTFQKNYLIFPLLQIIDNVLNKIYQDNYWGYSLPHYLSSTHNCHPNYATYLSNKNTLNTESINEVLERIPDENKCVYDKELIEKIYLEYQSKEYNDLLDINTLENYLYGKELVLIAPGPSVLEYLPEVKSKIKELNAITIGVNFLPQIVVADLVFMSNQKRYDQFVGNGIELNKKLIVTSNIESTKKEKLCCVNYNSVRNHIPFVEDNAMLMLLKLLIRLGVKRVYIAGMDGYCEDANKNYFDSNMTMHVEKGYEQHMNEGIKIELKKLSPLIQMKWLTPSQFTEEDS